MKRLEFGITLQNRYKIEKLIGKGGMGEVYLAVDHRLGHRIALKRTTVGDDATFARAFEREAQILAKVRHAVLPKVSDHFSENDEQYLVMEYISGEDLSKRLKSQKKPFPLNWVLFWADQLLDALNYIHTYSPPIIHRDIKPQNLKLTADNRIVLLDFGLSKNTLDQTKVTTSGSLVGYTPHYAPMEQIRGTGTDARSDIYSLSATLYQLMTGKVPQDALTRADILLAGSPDPLKPPSDIVDEVSTSLSDVILRGMELSQEKRYKTARIMQKALRKSFNQLQESMSADTIAFNVSEKEPEEEDFKTEVMSGLGNVVEAEPLLDVEELTSIEETPSVGLPIPVVLDDQLPKEEEEFSGDKTEVMDVAQFRDAVDGKSESPVEEEVAEPEEGDLTGMKTEVFTGEIIQGLDDSATSSEEDISGYQETVDSETSDASDEVPAEDFETSDDISEAESFEPDATVPLISLEGNDDESEAEAVDEEAVEDSPDDIGFVDEDNEEAPIVEDSQQESFEAEEDGRDEEETDEEDSLAVPPPEKSSTGKYLAILGGVGVLLLVLLGGAFGIGWYATNGNFGFNGEVATPSPTPEPTVETTPEPEVTPDDLDKDNSNTETDDSGNSNTEEDDSTNTNTNVNAEEDSSPSSTPTQSNPRATPRRTPTTKGKATPKKTPRVRRTPRKTPRKTPKRTPKKTPRKKKDPGILQ